MPRPLPDDLKHPTPDGAERSGAVLIAVAAPGEARAARRAVGLPDDGAPGPVWTPRPLAPGFDLLETGIGKSNAAGAVAAALATGRYRGVLSAGIAGVLPGGGLEILDVVVAESSVFADEGVETPGGWLDCAAIGFPLADFPGSEVPLTRAWVEALGDLGERGKVATVSTCSGTDALAARVAARTGARAEAMEGAAVALVARRMGVACAEVRVISNTTGDRERQHWDVKGALGVLSEVLGRVLRAG